MRPRDRKNCSIGGALNVAANPEFSHAKIFKNGGKTSQMILVRMRERDHVNSFDPARPQVGRNHIFADIDSGTHSARMKSPEFAAAVDQHGAPAGKERKRLSPWPTSRTVTSRRPWIQARAKGIRRDELRQQPAAQSSALDRHRNFQRVANGRRERDRESNKDGH